MNSTLDYLKTQGGVARVELLERYIANIRSLQVRAFCLHEDTLVSALNKLAKKRELELHELIDGRAQ